MAFWIELMCDIRKDGAGPSGIDPGCFTAHGSSPGHLTNSLSYGKKIVEESARERGWRKLKGKWVCPFCQKKE